MQDIKCRQRDVKLKLLFHIQFMNLCSQNDIPHSHPLLTALSRMYAFPIESYIKLFWHRLITIQIMRVLFLVSDYTEFLFIYPAHSFWMLRNLTRMCSHFCHFCWSGIVCSSYCNGANTDLRLWRHPRRGVVGLLRGHLEIGTEGCLDASRISMISAAGSFLVLRPRSLPLD